MIISRRTEGKATADFLLHKLEPDREAAAVSKRFRTYRKSLGVDDRPDGKRQSRVDFHSFRRWFITKARNAGFNRGLVAEVAGHEVGNITDDLYVGGADDDKKRAGVEAVRLPAQGCAKTGYESR